MSLTITVAVSWAGACGGCDVALLDAGEALVDLSRGLKIVYWPVAMDFKRSDLMALGTGDIDVGLFNGAIRTTEHAEDAQLLRERCKVLIAFGSCAAFGGIPGLANLHDVEELLDTVYEKTPTTDNPEGVRPRRVTQLPGGRSVDLPGLCDSVRALHQVVDVDYVVPGCPPTPQRVADALGLLGLVASGAELPASGSVIASSKALCDECPRVETRTGARIARISRPHEVIADLKLCFLEQGILCTGLVTRGGCGASCIEANMPCRGCFGPTDGLLDPAAEALSAIGSVAAPEHEDDLPASKRLAVVRSIVDPAGTCYRFTLPSAVMFRAVKDHPKE